jgi:outer membrane protein TolC
MSDIGLLRYNAAPSFSLQDNRIRNVQDSYMLVSSAETAKQQAEENLRVTQRRYASSVATLTDLLDAQSQWQQAQSNLIEAQTQYKIYETAYLKAVGALM